jgi:hypothetical protein
MHRILFVCILILWYRTRNSGRIKVKTVNNAFNTIDTETKTCPPEWHTKSK